VCFESREVAFEQGTYDDEHCDPDVPDDVE
jgi:hypothetical protein